jgi:integrase
MKDVQKRLGHAQLSTTMDIYVKSTEKMEKKTVSIFENAAIMICLPNKFYVGKW